MFQLFVAVLFVYIGSSTHALKQQIDVMVLYDEAVLTYYSTQQLETQIAGELIYSNEATANSLVDLQFNLVHAGKASDGIPDFEFRPTIMSRCHVPRGGFRQMLSTVFIMTCRVSSCYI